MIQKCFTINLLSLPLRTERLFNNALSWVTALSSQGEGMLRTCYSSHNTRGQIEQAKHLDINPYEMILNGCNTTRLAKMSLIKRKGLLFGELKLVAASIHGGFE